MYAAGLVFSLIAVGGCASGPASRFNGVTLHDDTLLIRGVAPILQSEEAPCGPACLASVAGYWDRPVSGASLRESLGDKASARAHSADDLANAARAMGLRAYVYQGDLADLGANLERGRPVIVLLRRRPLGGLGELGMNGALPERVAARFSPHKQHWVVVLGSDKKAMVVHDPALGLVRVERATFDGWWSQMAHVSLLIEPGTSASLPQVLDASMP